MSLRRRVPGKALAGPNKAEIVWHSAEGLLDHTDADVFVIFDCCHAGNLGRGYSQSRWSNRCSEFLGATSPNSTTAIPGENSFTSGLIWALKQLSSEPYGFTTSELRHKITEFPPFPKDQVPILCERNGSASLQHIVISPMSVGPTSSNAAQGKSPEDRSQAIVDYLDLRLLMDRSPSESEVGSLSNFFSDMIRNGRLPARRVALLDTRNTQIVRAVAHKWRNQARGRGRLSSLTIPGTRTGQSPSPSPISSIPTGITSRDLVEKLGRSENNNEEHTIRYHFRMLLLAMVEATFASLFSIIGKPG